MTNDVIDILRKQKQMANESINEISNGYKVRQLTTGALIYAYHNESSFWDSSLNASEEEKELAWAVSKLFNTRPGKNGTQMNSLNNSDKVLSTASLRRYDLSTASL